MKIESPDADENEDANMGKRRCSLGCGMPVGLGLTGSNGRGRDSSILCSPQHAENLRQEFQGAQVLGRL